MDLLQFRRYIAMTYLAQFHLTKACGADLKRYCKTYALTVSSTGLFHKRSRLAVHIAIQKKRRGVRNVILVFMFNVSNSSTFSTTLFVIAPVSESLKIRLVFFRYIQTQMQTNCEYVRQLDRSQRKEKSATSRRGYVRNKR